MPSDCRNDFTYVLVVGWFVCQRGNVLQQTTKITTQLPLPEGGASRNLLSNHQVRSNMLISRLELPNPLYAGLEILYMLVLKVLFDVASANNPACLTPIKPYQTLSNPINNDKNNNKHGHATEYFYTSKNPTGTPCPRQFLGQATIRLCNPYIASRLLPICPTLSTQHARGPSGMP
jgi:hypothetical protein